MAVTVMVWGTPSGLAGSEEQAVTQARATHHPASRLLFISTARYGKVGSPSIACPTLYSAGNRVLSDHDGEGRGKGIRRDHLPDPHRRRRARQPRRVPVQFP